MFDVEEFVAECRAALVEQHPAVAVKEVLERALSRPAAIDDVLGVPDRGGIVRSGGKELDAGDVVVLGRDVIHSVDNPRGAYTAAIHVYGGDFFATPRSEWDPDTLEEKPFDVEHTKQVLAEAEAAAAREA